MRFVPLLTLVEVLVVLALLAALAAVLLGLRSAAEGALTPRALPGAGLGAKAPKPKPTPVADITRTGVLLNQALAQESFDAALCAELIALRDRLKADGRFGDLVADIDGVLASHCDG
ncbi:hypothetical protein [Dinoroseobacter sp. S375]|uniref:hypothetical protein n=1 Tax=Dinoroseobacter sp. S375 TaxID=3415136 RepID=UPI003C7A2CB9